MNLPEKLLWLKMRKGLTVYLTDLEKPHHVTPEDFGALLMAVSLADSDTSMEAAFRAWRDDYTPDGLRASEMKPVDARNPRSHTGPLLDPGKRAVGYICKEEQQNKRQPRRQPRKGT